MGNVLSIIHDLDLVAKAPLALSPHQTDLTITKSHRHNPYLTLLLPRTLVVHVKTTSKLHLAKAPTFLSTASSSIESPSPTLSLTHHHPLLTNFHSTNLQQPNLIQRLPLEIWIQTLSYLYPSQLSRLCQVNKRLFDIVTNLSLWSDIYQTTAFPKKNSLDCLPGMPPSRSNMIVTCAHSFLVCEQCYSFCPPKKGGRAQLAAIPLKVTLPWSQPDAIRFCPPCRVQHFEHCPEPIPANIRGSRRSRSDIRRLYSLEDNDIRTLTRFGGGWEEITFSEEEALTLARKVYGGDVGIAALPRSFSKPLAKSYNRVYLFVLRRQVLKSENAWRSEN
ncbi:hypothetical protein BGZ94_005551 [Podila epigama]|nr:hypothetical protein BGZ94_005551 [Podila epigama]